MKKRVDLLLMEKGLAESRTKAQAYLMSGVVLVDGQKVDKAGTLVEADATVEIKEKSPYVSRGALKIEKAYKEFGLDLKNKVICDIGSSTGGFTDFALQHGAKRVYAIDVGYGQLDQKLREDSRVVVMEKTNFRNVSELPEKIGFFICDVSFISLKKIIPQIKTICHSRPPLSFPRRRESLRRINSGGNLDPRVKPEDDSSCKTQCILLIKPQFEVGKEIADKAKGVIKDEKIQAEVVEDIAKFAEENGFGVMGITESAITGAKGNREFLIWLKL
ncbi:TlyA family RNA methyltransferase [candidate division WS5 bacterium]|uniref:TlyA family RNA methyltransferase n=1 Tax=candidate division WS5 bacterium TaxID=2093353 RepID=A0A419DEN2_9BACT|nr:MAG: TlyA family RNA methyltransferase [candidate division WS5 bacterium]